VALVWMPRRRNLLTLHHESRSSCPACAQFPEKIVSIYDILTLMSLLFICMLYHLSAQRVGNWIKESPSERAEIHKNVKNEASMEHYSNHQSPHGNSFNTGINNRLI
jgi:hypothetical protein